MNIRGRIILRGLKIRKLIGTDWKPSQGRAGVASKYIVAKKVLEKLEI